jgi:DNA-binding LacI/PurR family transcriptional regulator
MKTSSKLNSAIEKLRQLCSTVDMPPLPPIQQLSQQWKISYQTIRKASKTLEKEGVLESVQGRGLRSLVCAAKDLPQEIEPGSSAFALYTKLKEQVLDGRIKVGDSLPKIDYYVINEKVSRTTVVQVLKALAADNLVYKKGIQWVVGAKNASRADATVHGSIDDSPVVLLISSNFLRLYRSYTSAHLAKFTSSFERELQNTTIRKEIIYTRESNDPSYALDTVRNAVKKLEHRYQGAILIDFHNAAHKNLPAMKYLISKRRPVVFFDHWDNPQKVTRKALGDTNRVFYYLHQDERSAVQLALDTLTRYGHKRIVVPRFEAEGYEWVNTRIALAQELAKEMQPAPELCIAPYSAEVWNPREWTPPFNEDIFGSSPQPAKAPKTVSPAVQQKRYARATSDLLKFIREQNATALLAVNDSFALNHFYRFFNLGVQIPRDLSILSFDNTHETQLFPLSTIDFGFDRLGYLAAHLLIGDIPIQVRASGIVAGSCSLQDSGSIAQLKI